MASSNLSSMPASSIDSTTRKKLYADPRARILEIEDELSDDSQSNSIGDYFTKEPSLSIASSTVTSFQALVSQDFNSPFAMSPNISYNNENNFSNMAVNVYPNQLEAFQSMEIEIETLNEELSEKAMIIKRLLDENYQIKEQKEESYYSEISEMREKIEYLQQKLSKAEKTISSLNTKLDEVFNENDEIQDRAQNLEERVITQENEIESLNRTISQKEKIISSLQKQIEGHIEDSTHEKHQSLKELEIKNFQLQNLINKQEITISSLRHEIEAKIDDSKSKQAISQSSILKLETENKELQSLINALESQLKEEHTKHEELEREASLSISSIKEEMASRIFTLKKEKQELEQKIEDLEEPCNTLEDTFESLQSEFSELGEKTLTPRENFCFNFVEKEANIAILTQEKIALQEQIKGLEDSLSWYKARFEESKLVDNNMLRQELSDAEKLIIEAKLKYAEAETHKDELKKKLNDAKKRSSKSVLSRIFRRKNRDSVDRKVKMSSCSQ
ncbi:unnamed protein product [Blepharisma stoltei]|uniref:Uncharacterized protein n=1 Tax=Blepharisma stoltei TaxID=1481888 RepID=A0AAU9K844_9CILI|nr:unnamed protein product [Blepharisma stoltei]